MKQVARVSVQELEAQHRVLDRQIKKLNHRGQHMTPVERYEAAELKKLRLAAKDRLLQYAKS
jgi:uncharacterized protein YdcH (DUF465 family)